MIKKLLISLIFTAQTFSAVKEAETCNPVSKTERTFAIIKPDAVKDKHSGEIINLIEKNKFNIIGMKKASISKEQAEKFYDIHKNKPFFKGLIEYMTSGPAILLALEKDNAVKEWRDLMGATNPENAAPGTIRRMFGTSVTYNAAHGSDSAENAKQELLFFFPELK